MIQIKYNIPKNIPGTTDLLCAANTAGIFACICAKLDALCCTRFACIMCTKSARHDMNSHVSCRRHCTAPHTIAYHIGGFSPLLCSAHAVNQTSSSVLTAHCILHTAYPLCQMHHARYNAHILVICTVKIIV